MDKVSLVVVNVLALLQNKIGFVFETVKVHIVLT